MTATRTWGWWVAGALLTALVVGAAIVASRPVPTYDLSTPEGTVQAFLQAVLDGDDETAAGFLSSEVDPHCVAELYRGPDTSVRVTLVSTDVQDHTATVRVRITFTEAQPPFGGSEYSNDATYRLERTDDGWTITRADWPFPCIERIPEP